MKTITCRPRRRHLPGGGAALGVLFLAALFSAPAHADFASFNQNIEKTLQGDWGKINFNLRWRFEYVDQEGKELARGDPLRLRLGYRSPEWSGFQAFLEFEGNTPVFADDYNSGRNDKPQYAVIADPAAAELNQGWLSYSGLPNTLVQAGRQKIVYNNHRFIGNVGWRQLEQTYDAAQIVNRTIGHSELRFAFIWNVRNILSEDVRMTSPILNLGYTFPGFGKLSAYGYWLDYRDKNDSGPFPFAFSTQTIGLRFHGTRSLTEALSLLYTAEYAHQTDFGKNPENYGADYAHLVGGFQIPEVRTGISDFTARVGWELLGSDHGISFKTPLGTNHAFQGWADKFLVTPPHGVKDLYGALGASLCGIRAQAIYHQFDAAEGSGDYGHEIDAEISRKFGKHYTISALYADYSATDFGTDTRKFWLQAVVDF